MKNKIKNPLYVVSEDQVQAAHGFVDFLVKKFNLEPAIEMITTLIKYLLEQVNSYPVFLAVKEFIDNMMKRLELFQRVAIF